MSSSLCKRQVLLIHIGWPTDELTAVGGAPLAPIGIAFIAGALKNIGISVQCRTMFRQTEPALALNGTRPSAVGISATGNDIADALALAHCAKAIWPGIPVVVGGYASSEPEYLLSSAQVDAVVIGEGEATAVELFPLLIEGNSFGEVRGIAYVDRLGNIKRTPIRPALDELDDLPIPNYEHIPRDTPILRIYASRGCPYRCTFCRIKDYYATPKIRHHSPGYIKEWILNLSNPKTKTIAFNDDEFLLSPRHFINMAELVGELGLRMTFQTRVADVLRHGKLVEKYLPVIHSICIGIESFSQSQLDRWKKDSTVIENYEVTRFMSNIGCPYYPYIILTDGQTTSREIGENIDGVLKLPPCPQPGLVRANISPLYSGLYLNRMKKFDGAFEETTSNCDLDAVWNFVGLTSKSAERLSSVCLHTALNEEGFDGAIGRCNGSISMKARTALDARLLRLTELAGEKRGSRRGRRLLDDAVAEFQYQASQILFEFMTREAMALVE